ncbi:unnamed protein product [Lota lota]
MCHSAQQEMGNDGLNDGEEEKKHSQSCLNPKAQPCKNCRPTKTSSKNPPGAKCQDKKRTARVLWVNANPKSGLVPSFRTRARANGAELGPGRPGYRVMDGARACRQRGRQTRHPR